MDSSVHLLMPRDVGVGLAVRVSNLAKIEQVFGWSAAKQIMTLISQTLIAEFGCSRPEDIGPGALSVYLDDASCCIDPESAEAAETQIARAVSSILLTRCIASAPEVIVPEIEVFCAVSGEGAPIMSDRSKLLAVSKKAMVETISSASCPSDNREEYAQMMGEGASFLAHLIEGDVAFVALPVVRHGDGAEMYESCVPATLDARSDLVAIDNLYDSLCKVAPTPVVEEYLFSQLIAHVLDDGELRLGHRLSGRCAGNRQYLEFLLQYFRKNRALARRVVVEIDASPGFHMRTTWIEFCRELKSLGVLTVLDRFGSGNSALRDILVLQPDFVKLEPGFLWRAQSGMETFQTLKHLIGLVHSLKAPAIVTGVDSLELQQLASDAGGIWLTGQHFGRGRMLGFTDSSSLKRSN
jgi:EAL domain-containing protein (putative c-di-GMP-specific phosphodiesterase class I)